MGQQSGKSQRKRTHKISAGLRRSSRPVQLTEIQKALMGKGLVATQPYLDCTPWRGAGEKRSR